MAAKPFPNLGMSKNEIDTLVAKVKADLNNVRYHGYFEYIFWTGQKPSDSTGLLEMWAQWS